ncbi:MAG: preprotein translocase subunit SecG [Pseudomonadota bacterium]|nr:preprotein translocase subunit SecG [Pseudomonadota bacterium]
MLLWILNIVYVLVAIAMIALILMQRGAGAAAGSGFGGGASATVFGARGASNFLSKSTKWLAIAFFGMTLGMAWLHMQGARNAGQQGGDLGVMANLPQEAAVPAENAAPAIPSAPVAPAESPAATPDVPKAENSAEKSAQEG